MTRPTSQHPTRFDYCLAELIRLAVLGAAFITLIIWILPQ